MRRSAETALLGDPGELAQRLTELSDVGVELCVLHLLGDGRLPGHRDAMARALRAPAAPACGSGSGRVRVGVALTMGADASLRRLASRARAADVAGLDLIWLQAPAVAQPLLGVSALAGETQDIRLGACVASGPHPLSIAEAASVADNCCAGRLVLAITEQDGDAGLLAETADVLLAATAPRPFAHAGARWRIPALLPENDGSTSLISLTPPCVQLELPIWLSGAHAAALAAERGLAWVRSETETAAGPEPLRASTTGTARAPRRRRGARRPAPRRAAKVGP